ncbi:MAG: flavin reductase family protein [Chitinophagaceae bacterium]
MPASKPVRKFITNVGLITSNGPYGKNIMAAEWTYKISSQPYLIMICIDYEDATYANIKASGEFGVNIAAIDQNVVASISGNHSGKEVDKIKVLEELGVEFYKADTIGSLMVKNAAMNAECKLKQTIEIGDHCLLIGEVQNISANEKEPLAYYNGKFWGLGSQIHKPGEETLKKIEELVEKFTKT